MKDSSSYRMPIEERGIFHAEYLFLAGKYGNDQC